MKIKRAVKYFVYANLVAWLMTFSYVGLLAYSLVDYAQCGIGNVEVDGCILPLDFPEESYLLLLAYHFHMLQRNMFRRA